MSDTESDPQTDPEAEGGSAPRETDVQESDPNADSAHGLSGGMGVSSERVGDLRGTGGEQGTYGARTPICRHPRATSRPSSPPTRPPASRTPTSRR